MKSIHFRLLIAALAVLMGSAIAKSQTADATPPPPAMHGHEFGMGHMGMDGHMMGFFARKLNLTDDQKTQMHSIMEKEHPAMKALHEQERQVELQLRQYVEGTYDEAKVQAIAAQKAQIEVQLTVAETRVHNEMYQILTADQKAQLKQMQADHEARMQQHMNHEPAASPEQ
jgi:protein CpxP